MNKTLAVILRFIIILPFVFLVALVVSMPFMVAFASAWILSRCERSLIGFANNFIGHQCFENAQKITRFNDQKDEVPQ